MAALLPAGALAFSATVLPRLIAPPVPLLPVGRGEVEKAGDVLLMTPL